MLSRISLRRFSVLGAAKAAQKAEVDWIASKNQWSYFNDESYVKRSESLKLNKPEIRESLLSNSSESGPASIENYSQRLAYHSPVAIDETFKMAYEMLETDAGLIYKNIDRFRAKLKTATDEKEIEFLKKTIDKLLVSAEISNPEVLYNATFNPASTLDMSQPVYRQLAKEKWESYDLMITMQRLEQLHVIPDTLPTLEPKVDVKVKFPHNLEEEFSSWVTPGEILPAYAVAQPPTIQIQEFDTVESKQLYSVLIVNPDTPDLATNSFSTTLQYGLANVPLDNVDNVIDTKKLLENGDKFTFKDYVPLVPEKNAQNQRACLWVFKQNGELSIGDVARENFDIRAFVETHGLNAVGAHVWRQHFDRSVETVREQYGLGKGRVFRRVRGTKPIIE